MRAHDRRTPEEVRRPDRHVSVDEPARHGLERQPHRAPVELRRRREDREHDQHGPAVAARELGVADRRRDLRAGQREEQRGEAERRGQREQQAPPRRPGAEELDALGAQEVDETDFHALEAAGFTREDVWDIAAIAAFFGLSNRMANLTGMRPNDEFYLMGRVPRTKA